MEGLLAKPDVEGLFDNEVEEAENTSFPGGRLMGVADFGEVPINEVGLGEGEGEGDGDFCPGDVL